MPIHRQHLCLAATLVATSLQPMACLATITGHGISDKFDNIDPPLSGTVHIGGGFTIGKQETNQSGLLSVSNGSKAWLVEDAYINMQTTDTSTSQVVVDGAGSEIVGSTFYVSPHDNPAPANSPTVLATNGGLFSINVFGKDPWQPMPNPIPIRTVFHADGDGSIIEIDTVAHDLPLTLEASNGGSVLFRGFTDPNDRMRVNLDHGSLRLVALNPTQVHTNTFSGSGTVYVRGQAVALGSDNNHAPSSAFSLPSQITFDATSGPHAPIPSLASNPSQHPDINFVLDLSGGRLQQATLTLAHQQDTNIRVTEGVQVHTHSVAAFDPSNVPTMNAETGTQGAANVTIDGEGSTWSNWYLFDLRSPTGKQNHVTIESGGTFVASRFLSQRTGLIADYNPTLVTDDKPYAIGLFDGTLDMHNASIHLIQNQTNGKHTDAFAMHGGFLKNTSQITATQAELFFQQGGWIQPGDQIGTTRFSTLGLEIANGGLDLDIHDTQGLPGTGFDQVIVDHQLVLGANSQLRLNTSSDNVSLGDRILLIQINNLEAASNPIDGQFGTIEGMAIHPNLVWAVTHTTDGIWATAATPGDIDLDGDVDLDDLTVLGTFYDTTGTWSNGDLNGDSQISLDDLTILGTFYGQNNNVSFAQALAMTGLNQVPEPASTTATMALCLFGLRRRRAV